MQAENRKGKTKENGKPPRATAISSPLQSNHMLPPKHQSPITVEKGAKMAAGAEISGA
jgi:hypothetical protein